MPGPFFYIGKADESGRKRTKADIAKNTKTPVPLEYRTHAARKKRTQADISVDIVNGGDTANTTERKYKKQ